MLSFVLYCGSNSRLMPYNGDGHSVTPHDPNSEEHTLRFTEEQSVKNFA